MKLYPWFVQPYKKIIQKFQTQKSHHAILINMQKGMDGFKLIWMLSRWLLCKKPTDVYFCNHCVGCKLMDAKNHPDWHSIKSKKNIIDIDSIREMIKKILKCPQQGFNKVVVLSNTEKITESAVNAFLKILEEPPENTFFLLRNSNHINMHPTLFSRCLPYKIFTPKEKDSIYWLQNEIIEKKENICFIKTVLRIHSGAPVSSKTFINQKIWIERENVCQTLLQSCQEKNLLKMLPILNQKEVVIKIDWICLLLFDAVKLFLKEEKYLINTDQRKLILFFYNHYSYSILHHSIQNWMECKKRFLHIPGINSELLLTEQLLTWEKILKFHFQ